MEKNIITFKSNNDNLIWRSPVVEIDENTSIICPPTHEVIFIKEGMMEDIFNQGTHKPIKKAGLFKKAEKYQCEIIYVNNSREYNIFWGTPTRIDIMDPFSKMLVKYGACGKYTITVENTRRLYEKILSSNNVLTIDAIKDYFMDSLIFFVKKEISDLILENNVGFNMIYSYLDDVSERIVNKIQGDFNRAGIKICGLTFTNIIIDDEVIDKIKDKINNDEPMMFCPSCGKEVEVIHRFCPFCAKDLSSITKCPKCHGIINSDDIYCMSCGNKLKE